MSIYTNISFICDAVSLANSLKSVESKCDVPAKTISHLFCRLLAEPVSSESVESHPETSHFLSEDSPQSRCQLDATFTFELKSKFVKQSWIGKRYHSSCSLSPLLPVPCGRNVQPSHSSPRTDHRIKRPEEQSQKSKEKLVISINKHPEPCASCP